MKPKYRIVQREGHMRTMYDVEERRWYWPVWVYNSTWSDQDNAHDIIQNLQKVAKAKKKVVYQT
jgi:hypothetical protein